MEFHEFFTVPKEARRGAEVKRGEERRGEERRGEETRQKRAILLEKWLCVVKSNEDAEATGRGRGAERIIGVICTASSARGRPVK